jgi:hypothetical protein
MNLYEAVRMQRIRAAVRAVRTGGACSSVWRCARYSVRTVMRVAVCGSALGSVWQCARQCAAVQRCARYSVRTVMRVAVCGSALGSVWQCARQCAAVQRCGSVWQCTQQCAAVCSSVWQCVAVRLAVCGSALYILLCTQSFTIYIGMLWWLLHYRRSKNVVRMYVVHSSSPVVSSQYSPQTTKSGVTYGTP